MTLTEALGELGLESGADPDQVRRAYLNLIKTRRPETDPEGFQRAREAFEVARAAGELEAFASAPRRFSHQAPAATAAPSATDATDATDATNATNPTTTGGVSTGSGPDQVTPDGLEPFMRDWQALSPTTAWQKRLEVARAAVAVCPRDARAHWLVVSSLSGFGTDAELAEALRAGQRTGERDFLEALLVRVPRAASADEIDEALRSDHLPLRLAAAVALADRDGARAAAVVVEACQVAGSRPVTLPVTRFLDVILLLHQTTDFTWAAVAQAAFRELLREQGLELQLLRGPVGGVWTLTEELGALPPDFPLALRRSFAAATRGGDLRGAFYDACFHVRHHRSEVVRWSRRIAAHAPNVARTLVGALQRERQRHDHAPHRGWVWWLAAPLMVGFVRLLASGLDGGSPGGAAVPSVQAPVVALSPSRQPWADMLHEAVSTLCDRPGSLPDHLTCDEVRAFESAVAAHDCPQARALRERLRQDLGEQTPSPNESRILARGDLAMWQFCRRSAGGPDSPGKSPP